jgi:hypothetical protein
MKVGWNQATLHSLFTALTSLERRSRVSNGEKRRVTGLSTMRLYKIVLQPSRKPGLDRATPQARFGSIM